jgi:RND family efflux transporter MFP subunit
MERGFDLTGEFRPWQQADLHAKVAGYLKTLNVDIGSRVGAGQVIAVLEVPELEAEREEATATVQHSKSEESRARASIDRARAQVAVAKASSDRLNEVNQREKGLVARQELDEAAARHRAAEADLAIAEAALNTSGQATQAAKARLSRIEAMLHYARITAPFSGVVTKRYVDPGNMIQAGTNSQTQAVPVVQIASTSKLRLSIVVPESAVPDVHVGTGVDIRVPSLGRNFQGRIARLTENVVTSTRTMAAEIDIPNSDHSISPGIVAVVRLRTTSTRDVLAVPVQAISRRGGQSFLFTVGPKGTVEERTVKSGLESASHIEVVEGVSAEDRVIVGAKALVRPGQTVEPAEEIAN